MAAFFFVEEGAGLRRAKDRFLSRKKMVLSNPRKKGREVDGRSRLGWGWWETVAGR